MMIIIPGDLQLLKFSQSSLKLGGETCHGGNDDGDTALHLACRHNFSIKLVSRLIDIGGRELVAETNNFGDSPLHDACKNELSPVNVISKLVDIGGKVIICDWNNDGLHALHCFYTQDYDEYHNTTFSNCFILILKAGIAMDIGGKFEIGGLFNVIPNDNEVQRQIYDKSEHFVPSLVIVIATLQTPPPPLLHTAIIAGAP